MIELVYGMDPLCGWCFGISPAIQKLRADHPDLPIRPVLAGLVTGARVGPYAEMEGYIRAASVRLRAVTGRAPSEAFFDMIRSPGVRGDSAPPSVAIASVRQHRPDALLDFVLHLTEAHFERGFDLSAAETYETLFGELGIDVPIPQLDDLRVAEMEWARGRALGLTSFPSLWLQRDGVATPLAVDYDPERLSETVRQALKRAD